MSYHWSNMAPPSDFFKNFQALLNSHDHWASAHVHTRPPSKPQKTRTRSTSVFSSSCEKFKVQSWMDDVVIYEPDGAADGSEDDGISQLRFAVVSQENSSITIRVEGRSHVHFMLIVVILATTLISARRLWLISREFSFFGRRSLAPLGPTTFTWCHKSFKIAVLLFLGVKVTKHARIFPMHIVWMACQLYDDQICRSRKLTQILWYPREHTVVHWVLNVACTLVYPTSWSGVNPRIWTSVRGNQSYFSIFFEVLLLL